MALPAEDIPSERLWRLPSWLLNMVSARANRLVGERFGRPGRRLRHAVLAGIEEFGPISQAALGRRLGVDRSDMVAVLNELEGEGLARRAPDDHDRRRNAIRATPAGTAALCELDDLVSDAQVELLDPLSPRERAQFVELLQRLLSHHAGYRPAGVGPGDERERSA